MRSSCRPTSPTAPCGNGWHSKTAFSTPWSAKRRTPTSRSRTTASAAPVGPGGRSSSTSSASARTSSPSIQRRKKILWHHKEADSIDSRGMAMLKGKLYYYSEGKFLACLDAKDGKIIWKNSSKELLDAVGKTKAAQHWLLGFASTAYLKCSDDALYFAGPNRPLLVAASTKDGKLLWKKDCSVKDGNFPTEGGNVQLVIRDRRRLRPRPGPHQLANEQLQARTAHRRSARHLPRPRSLHPCHRLLRHHLHARRQRGQHRRVRRHQHRAAHGSDLADAARVPGRRRHRPRLSLLGPVDVPLRHDPARRHQPRTGRRSSTTWRRRPKRIACKPIRAISAAAIHKTPSEWPTYRHDNARSVQIEDVGSRSRSSPSWTWTPEGADACRRRRSLSATKSLSAGKTASSARFDLHNGQARTGPPTPAGR